MGEEFDRMFFMCAKLIKVEISVVSDEGVKKKLITAVCFHILCRQVEL